MRQTNYQLFDFLDFDTSLDGNERLWRALPPNSFSEHNGDIFIKIPFQKQINSNDISPDLSVAPVEYTLRIRAYGESILRVSAVFDGEIQETSEMLEFRDIAHCLLSIVESENKWIIKDEKEVVRTIFDFTPHETEFWSDLQPAPQPTLKLTFYPDGKNEVKLVDYDMFSPARHDAFALAMVEQDGKPNRVTCSFAAKADECFMGTGERFAKMDLSGHTVQLRNQDGQGVNNRRTYKNIPFYLSTENYGLFLHTTSFGKFSLADHSTRSAQILVEEPLLDFFLIGGDKPEEILLNYRRLTGFPQMPPLWSFGIWMSRMTYFSADEVNEICDRLRRENYPCDVIHLDTGWFETDWLCEWKFNRERFPNPKEFIKRLKDNGFYTTLWQLPYIAYNAEQYTEASENNYICKTKRKIGGASNFSVQDYAGTIDFTYQQATEWYKGLLKNLFDMGVAGIKADFGEEIHTDAEYHAMSAEKLQNLYPLLYQKAVYEITKESTNNGIIWARAAWAGCQRYPVHWGGDAASSWDGLAGSLKGGLHFGLSGFAFWSHDVPGFHSLPDFMNSPLDNELYVRWTQFGIFSSHIRYHGSHRREPWYYPEIQDIIRRWWQLRYKLMPYILEQSEKSVKSGFPLLRALYLMHPEDKTCRHIDDQYYFGDDILVAPLVNSGGVRDVYLPDGEWINFFTKEVFSGNRWLQNIKTPLDEMPVFVRRGAKIPIYPDEINCTDDMDFGKIVFEEY
jgi:Alpha-glucosidases, family 31 of glycosyl hydrolases